MKKFFFISLLVLAGAFFLIEKKAPIVVAQSKISATKKSTETAVKNLSLQIAALNDDPVQTEIELHKHAQKLSPNDFPLLQKMALDRNEKQDQRFVAVTLLALSNQIQSADHLKNIALTPIDPYLSVGPNADFEKVLRMRAVEGLGEIPLNSNELSNYLSQIISSSDITLIVDRAQRLNLAYQGLAPTPEQQDQEALKKLLRY